jgi:beta-N-acetylhexosaminidase
MNKVIKVVLVFALILILAFIFWPKVKQEQQDDGELMRKIGQMLIIGFRGTEVNGDSQIIKDINQYNIGGIILFDRDAPSKSFPRNIINPEQTKKLITDVKQLSSSDIFVSIDAEGGLINRLKEKYGFINIPSPEDMGKDTPEKTKENAVIIAKELKDLGFNVDFAPVVDVNVNPDNPVIGYLGRSFSEDPEKVAIYASKFIEGLNQENIISAIKHFPGHGSSTADSHLGMVDITKTYKQEELIPYQRLIENGYSQMVMTAHIVNTNIDPDYPATLSPKLIKNILRDQLKFNGVVVSDDMNMGAIVDNYGFDEALVKAINAGCDMLIISNNGTTYNENAAKEATETIFKAVKRGEISEEQINQSFQRIQELKQRYGIK